AELGGRGRMVFEHDPGLQAASEHADADATGGDWLRLLAAHDVRWLLVTPSRASGSLQAALQRGARRVDAVGDVESWEVDFTAVDGTAVDGTTTAAAHPLQAPEAAR